MAALPRVTQKRFGSTPGVNQVSVFGSLAAGTPTYTTDPTAIQSIGNFLVGWYGAVVGNNSPAIQDMNALFVLAFYQLAYLFENGIPAWDAGTTYYTYSIVRGGASTNGGLYQSTSDANVNHPVTNTDFWKRIDNSGTDVISIVSGARQLYPYDSGRIFEVDTSIGTIALTLPTTIPSGFNFTVKDIAANLSNNPVSIVRSGSEKIEGLAADYVCAANYGSWNFEFDGTNVWMI
jgi:hypothetical protein